MTESPNFRSSDFLLGHNDGGYFNEYRHHPAGETVTLFRI